jgi:hypothetical protein
MKDEATYVCDSCGEEIVWPIDLSAGSLQEYVEDRPARVRAAPLPPLRQADDAPARALTERC